MSEESPLLRFAEKYPSAPSDVAIVGSMKFYDKQLGLKEKLEAQGLTVAVPDPDGDDWEAISHDEQIERKRVLGERQLGRITMATTMLVANYEKHGIEGYVGPNTQCEIVFAENLGIKTFMLNRLSTDRMDEFGDSDVFGRDMLSVVSPSAEIIDGDLKKIEEYIKGVRK
jgi:hypothetical protein